MTKKGQAEAYRLHQAEELIRKFYGTHPELQPARLATKRPPADAGQRNPRRPGRQEAG